MFYEKLMDIAVANGCTSGADWNKNGKTNDESLVDWPHVQWGALAKSPSEEDREFVNANGVVAFWEHVGAA